MRKGRFAFVSIVLILAVFALVYYGIQFTSNLGKTDQQVSAEGAASKLAKLYGKLGVTTEPPVKGQIDLDPVDVAASLPDISKFPIAVEPTTDTFLEIFSSTEKSGSGVDAG